MIYIRQNRRLHLVTYFIPIPIHISNKHTIKTGATRRPGQDNGGGQQYSLQFFTPPFSFTIFYPAMSLRNLGVKSFFNFTFFRIPAEGNWGANQACDDGGGTQTGTEVL